MSLEIKENRGIFEIFGKVTTQHIGALNSYFDSILEKHESIVISLENITFLDSAAAHFFEKLYLKSVKQNKVVSLIGRQNMNIQEIMNVTQTNYILSKDRV
ncbi:STAS domain-containing protein [Flagellimonas sp. HMM57]|uniref:STAS domain-containing protein n=1 Tax=unclassified Flagellimonas TaxID=2644544 RepID=UPI0013D0FB43|nr:MULTISPECIES: STAS domain-containing protein [unclassified Flagellimonas]UII77107.1 STAS domain-containing protein [Flagellimonas sp. HMM57]